MRGRNALAAVIAVAGLLALAPGCDDGVAPQRWDLQAGRLQGSVMVAGEPHQASVWIQRLDENPASDDVYRVRTSQDGHWRLDVPEGSFRLELQLEDGPSFFLSSTGVTCAYAEWETIRVVSGLPGKTFDLAFGSIGASLELGEGFEDLHGTLRLESRDSDVEGLFGNCAFRGFGEVEDGLLEVEVVGVPPGDYRVQFGIGEPFFSGTGSFDGEWFWWPGVRDSAFAPWYTVGLEDPFVLPALEGVGHARLEGEVTGAWLDFGIEHGPKVILVGSDSTIVAGPRYLDGDGDGAYAFDLLFPEPVKVAVSHEGWTSWVGGATYEEATLFPLAAGEMVTGVDLLTCGIRLLVVDEGIEFWGAEATLFDVSDTVTPLGHSELWKSGRHLLIPNLVPGSYHIHLEPRRWYGIVRDWCPQWYDRAADPADAMEIVLSAPGEVFNGELVLERGGEIHGTAQWPGEELGSCHAVLTTAVDQQIWEEDYLPSPGAAFEFRGLPDGGYRLGLTRSDWYSVDTPLWYPGTENWEEAEILEIQDSQVIEGLEFVVD